MTRPDDPIQKFCDYYHDYHSITVTRRKVQTRALRQMEAWLAPIAVLDIEAENFNDYLAHLHGSGLHVNTVRFQRNAIRPFLTWAWERKLIDGDRLLELRNVRAPRGASGQIKPNPYERHDRERLWQELEVAYPWCRQEYDRRTGAPHPRTRARGEYIVDRWKRDVSPWRRVQPFAMRLQMEAVIALAIIGALRRNEIFHLTVQELDPDNEYIVVHSHKNPMAEKRVRAVPWIADQMRISVREWLEFRALMAPEHDSPWLSLVGIYAKRPMQLRKFEMLMRKLGTGWEFHRMRHTAATLMVRSEMPLERVAPILGHSRLEMTRQYAKLTPTDSVIAARRVSAAFTLSLGRPEVELGEVKHVPEVEVELDQFHEFRY